MSVLPITLIVLLLHFTISPLKKEMILAFLFGAILVIIGLTIFLFGIDQGIEPIGRGAGNVVLKSNRYTIAVSISLVLGFFISFAEPDLHILAKQASEVTAGQLNNMLMVVTVSIGIGIMMTLGMMRILKNIRVRYVFAFAYLLIFLLAFFSTPDFLAIAFDASGATTGAITVPFMLALAGGISSMKKDSTVGEADNFGIIGISSTGAILGVLITGFFLKSGKLTGELAITEAEQAGLFHSYADKLGSIAWESLLTLLPIMITYAVIQIFSLRQKRKQVIRICKGLGLTYAGLVLFLLGINGGFMKVGSQIGMQLASSGSSLYILLVALLLGVSTVLAEPAVHVLTDQIEEVTGGSVKRMLVLLFLSGGVGLSIFISSLRILLPEIQLWMYLLPGFGLAILMSFFIPDLFVGMAIDAGGVASGPMTATFSLAFIQGIAAEIPTADVVTDGFGMIAIVAMVPILAIEFFGILYQRALRKSGTQDEEKGGDL